MSERREVLIPTFPSMSDLSGTWLETTPYPRNRKIRITHTGKDTVRAEYVEKYDGCFDHDGFPLEYHDFTATITDNKLEGTLTQCIYRSEPGWVTKDGWNLVPLDPVLETRFAQTELKLEIVDGRALRGTYRSTIHAKEWRPIFLLRETQFVTRFTASLATVSEIPANSLPGLSMTGLQVTEESLRSWSPKWIGEYQQRNEAHPLDASFSDSRQFRFMHVLSAFVESPDQRSITEGDFLPLGPGGEYTTEGLSVLGFGPIEPPARMESWRITVDKIDVMIFESVYGGQERAPQPEMLIKIKRFPPIWTAIRVALSADGKHASEMFDYSYFPQHFVFNDGVYHESTIEDIQDWLNLGWGQLKPGDGSIIFDADAAERWWRRRIAPSADPWQEQVTKASIQGNPFNI